MADTSLTKEHGLSLLTQLAQNDEFRAHFESKPAEALLKLGIPAELICGLPARCLCPRTLAPRAEMEEARKRLASDADRTALSFIVPTAKVR